MYKRQDEGDLLDAGKVGGALVGQQHELLDHALALAGSALLDVDTAAILEMCIRDSQSILDLLAGNRHQAGHIAEGADLLAGLEGPLALSLIHI